MMWVCFRVWYPNGFGIFLGFFTILVSVWVKFFAGSAHPYPFSCEEPTHPNPTPTPAWACVHNGTTQRGRLADGVRQSASCIMPFWTHAKCLLAFVSYIPMWIKSQNTLIKTVYSTLSYGSHYVGKHTFSPVFCFELRERAARTCCHCHLAVKNPIRDGKQDQLKLPKSHERNRMWSCDTELCTNGVEASKGWIFIIHFSIYSTTRYCCHAGTDIPRLRGQTLQISQVVRAVKHWISGCAPTLANQVPVSPVKTVVIRMS